MQQQIKAVAAELLKIKGSAIIWVTFIAFALGPVMGGLALHLLGSSDAVQSSSMLGEKARLMDFAPDWNSFFTILSQVVGVGGVVVFGFAASWLFGREYSDNTAKDLLALPTSRSKIINAKFIVYVLWCLGLIFSNLILGLGVGSLLNIHDFNFAVLSENLETYFLTAAMVISLGTPISFMGVWGRGYLAPIGFVVLMLVISQIIGALGFGQYFPWSIPGLYSGISVELKATVGAVSFLIIGLVAVAGFAATHLLWNRVDQG